MNPGQDGLNPLDPVSPLPLLAAVLLAFGTAAVLQRWQGAPSAAGRHASIDGLRGYLAFGVFLHHACIWYFYQHSGQWERPPSRLYSILGYGNVALFFMITGFLFFSKLIDARGKPLDWLRLFISRILRLGPLYLMVLLLLFAAVALLSAGELHDTPRDIVKQVLQWLSFTILGSPRINQVPQTVLVLAGVSWSLPYEWFFYGCLPLLALTVGVLPRWPYLLLGLATLVGLLYWHPAPLHLWAFAGGIVAAPCARSPLLCKWARSRWATVGVLACLAGAVSGFLRDTAHGELALLTLAFIAIACGNDLFGLLVHPTSRLLGEMAYSIYLLHGMLLFALFHFMLGADSPGGALPASTHWAWTLLLVPCLVLVSYASFRFVETPPMRWTIGLTQAVRHRFQRLQDRLVA